MHPILLNAAGHRRQPVTLPGYHAGRPPRNKGRRYPADPPTVDEIIAVMRQPVTAPTAIASARLIVVLWRAGLRINEALSLTETDWRNCRGAVLVGTGYAEFGIGRVMPGRWLCRVWGDVAGLSWSGWG